MKLHLVLGDQLSPDLASLRGFDPTCDMVLMCEVRSEATYVKHHKKKIAFIFSAMRHFAEELTQAGFPLRYTKFDDAENAGSLIGEVRRAMAEETVSEIVLTEPGEYRLAQEFRTWSKTLGVPVAVHEDDRFLCSHQAFETWASGRKQLRMEYFYREMRRKYGVLMDQNDPIGGQWNYDSENRKSPKIDMQVPAPFAAQPSEITQEVFTLVEGQFGDHFGDVHPFPYAVTRAQAQAALVQFIEERLPQFGDYQDAMMP